MKILILILCLWFIVTKPAYAYLDPGSASIILTAIMGSIAALGAATSLYWRKIKKLISKVFSRKNKESDK